MIEIRSKTFRSGNSEAVRLPKEVAFGLGVDVTIRRFGDTVEITRRTKPKLTPRELVARLREIGPPPGPRVGREKIIFPKRHGL